jgi:hypothetical protein
MVIFGIAVAAGTVAGIAVIVVFVWLIVGGFFYHASGGASAPTPTGIRPDCVACARLDRWWNSLDWIGKLAGAVWYGAQKLVCVLKGC